MERVQGRGRVCLQEVACPTTRVSNMQKVVFISIIQSSVRDVVRSKTVVHSDGLPILKHHAVDVARLLSSHIRVNTLGFAGVQDVVDRV